MQTAFGRPSSGFSLVHGVNISCPKADCEAGTDGARVMEVMDGKVSVDEAFQQGLSN